MAGGEPVRGSGLITGAMRHDQTKQGIRPEEEDEKNPALMALRALQVADDATLQEKWAEEDRRRERYKMSTPPPDKLR